MPKQEWGKAATDYPNRCTGVNLISRKRGLENQGILRLISLFKSHERYSNASSL